jgi:hypothetical protein
MTGGDENEPVETPAPVETDEPKTDETPAPVETTPDGDAA